jgi:tetratricopeptide (TPR) repeat protein
VDLDPKDTKALDFIGKMYDVSPAMADEVTRRLAHFAALYPDNARANYYYALSLRQRTLNGGVSSDSDAKRLLIKAVAIDPQFADAHYELGVLYQDEGAVEKAILEYETAVRLRPGLKPAHYRLGRLYADRGQAELARREFQIVRSLQPVGK